MFFRSMIIRFFCCILICSGHDVTLAFSTCRPLLPLSRKPSTMCKNWIGDTFNELIEFSTLGPGERKLLKAKRDKAANSPTEEEEEDVVSVESFKRAEKKFGSYSPNEYPTTTEDSLSLEAFQSAIVSKEKEDVDFDFDGYKLRDLLIEKWGVPLDIDFQRGIGGQSVYCTVLPVAYGSKKCRHESELDYLMHLQGVIEILQKYNNLDQFIISLQKTRRSPKPGVESVPFLLELDSQSLKQIL
jgi:hypothetical protein